MAEIKIDQTWLWNIGFENPVPSVERQIKRMFRLLAFHAMAGAAYGIQNEAGGDKGQEREFFERVRSWVVRNAEDELTLHERHDFATPPEQWHAQHFTNGGWCFQAAATIGWALGLNEWRPVWSQFDESDLSMSILEESVADVLPRVKPHTLQEMEMKDSVSCAWAWRATTERMKQAGIFNAIKMKKYLRAWTEKLAESGQFDPPADGDYSVEGIAFRNLPKDRQLQIGSSAFERLHALHWLCGQELLNEYVSCDT